MKTKYLKWGILLYFRLYAFCGLLLTIGFLPTIWEQGFTTFAIRYIDAMVMAGVWFLFGTVLVTLFVREADRKIAAEKAIRVTANNEECDTEMTKEKQGAGNSSVFSPMEAE